MTEKKPHICFVSPYITSYLYPNRGESTGGAERQQYIIGKKLRDEGYQVSYIAFQDEHDDEEQLKGFQLVKVLPKENSINKAPLVIFNLLRAIKKVDADIYYSRGNPPLCILTHLCCRTLRKKYVYCVANDSNLNPAQLPAHHRMFKYSLFRKLYYKSIKFADAVIAQTTKQQELLRDRFGIESTLIPNTYTIPDDSEIYPIEKRKYFLWVGSIEQEQKQPFRYLRLAETLPEIHFKMIGSKGDKAFYKKVRSAADEIPNLDFAGFVPPDEIHQYYQKSIALVNTSNYEGFPNTFLEAWRYGIPVISLYYSMDNLLESEEIGLLSGSMSSLCSDIESIHSNECVSTKLGINGRNYLKQNYSISIVFDKYERLFQKVV